MGAFLPCQQLANCFNLLELIICPGDRRAKRGKGRQRAWGKQRLWIKRGKTQPSAAQLGETQASEEGSSMCFGDFLKSREVLRVEVLR